MSGSVARTRHLVNNATVFASPRRLLAEARTSYRTKYSVQLGCLPTRGAVWVEPSMASATAGFEVTFNPKRAVLYDNETSVEVEVHVTWSGSVGTETTLTIQNTIESCDRAFLATDQFPEENTVYLEVRFPRPAYVLPVSIVIPSVVVVALLFVALRMGRRASDDAWAVKSSELHFKDPPEIVGPVSYTHLTLPTIYSV